MALKNYQILLLLGLLSQLFDGSLAACEDHSDCKTCIVNAEWWVSCRWCALTNACHSVTSYYENVCSASQQVTASSQRTCEEVSSEPATAQYSSTIAQQMARWSSLAYTPLQDRDHKQTQAMIQQYVDPSYQVVEYIASDCGMPMEEGDCAVVILLSHIDKRVVVAFRGTESNMQLFEEFIGGVTGLLEFQLTGGQILSYFKVAHNSLYGCVQFAVRKLIVRYPKYKVYVTGHSLGGAEAQLTAVSLIAEGIVHKDNVVVYTFGSPRVGDKDFAFGYDQIIGESWRVVNLYDPIPKIVPTNLMFMPYAYHTRREVYYETVNITTSTPYTVCKGNEDESCSYQHTICLTESCIYSHMKYFDPALQDFMSLKITKTAANNKTTLGKCDAYSY